MKIFWTFACMGLVLISCQQEKKKDTFPPPQATAKKEIVYDAALAQKLGGDEYGMKRYVMVFLKTGKQTEFDSVAKSKLMEQHMKNMNRLAEAGKLIVAGPYLGDKQMRGMFVFNVESVAEAKKLAETDPAIQAGIFDIELLPWYGSAALIETTQIHKKIAKTKLVD